MVRRGLPLYVQIESLLRERIRSGEYPAGGPFPTEEKLRSAFGVSRLTIRTALDALHRDGLIVRSPGRGSFVTEVADRLRSLRFEGSIEGLIEHGDGAATDFRVTERLLANPTAAEATELKIPSGKRVVRITGVRERGDERVAHVIVSLPAAPGATLRIQEGRVYPPIAFLLGQKLGAKIREARQVIAVAAATPGVARTLRLRVGAPLLTIRRTYFSAEGVPVEFAISSYPGDRYQYEAVILSKG